VPDDSDEDRFVTTGQVAAYGMFVGSPSVEELERLFFLDDDDRRLVAKRRGDGNRLGFSLQLTIGALRKGAVPGSGRPANARQDAAYGR
jgi:Domain of unknown function (DUF4158)